MFKKFGSFFKIDNNNINNSDSINNSNKNNAYFSQPIDNTISKQAMVVNDENSENSKSIYHGYIARHRRLSAEIDRKLTNK